MNNHRWITKWGDVTGWTENDVSCDLDDAHHCSVIVGTGLQTTTIVVGRFTDDGTKRLIWALDRAFERGDRAARAEIRKALGVTEPRH